MPQLEEAARRNRRIGLGIMGLADLMYHVGVRYGSAEGQEFGAQVMEFVRYHSMLTSIDLARERGSFPAITGSIYDPENLTWEPPFSIVAYEHDWARPEVDWNRVTTDIRLNGIRNAAQTTVAPTGTIATVAGCEGYGCEPVFALAYIRHVNDNGKDLQLTYTSPLFEEALISSGLDEETRASIVEQVKNEGTCQNVFEIPPAIRDVFVVSQDVNAEEHVRMQAALQAFVDNSLSKTINFPPPRPPEDVAAAYTLAWELGCKGITVYVTGSREKVVLETQATVSKKSDAAVVNPETGARRPAADAARALAVDQEAAPALPGGLHLLEWKPRSGKPSSPSMKMADSQPFEVFINTAKAGSDTAAVSEAIGRLVSYVLRISSPVEPSERIQEVIRQLNGIGGGRSLGFGPKRVRSLPDGVSQVLSEYIQQRAERLLKEQPVALKETTVEPVNIETPAQDKKQPLLKIGDLCPECGQAAVINEEGCRKCYACGYSEC